MKVGMLVSGFEGQLEHKFLVSQKVKQLNIVWPTDRYVTYELQHFFSLMVNFYLAVCPVLCDSVVLKHIQCMGC